MVGKVQCPGQSILYVWYNSYILTKTTMTTKNRRNLMILVSWVIALAVIFGVYEVLSLNIAHSSFENYYEFRGCTQLLQKTDTFGTCVTKSGETIKLVKFNDKGYLDGDLPCGFLCF